MQLEKVDEYHFLVQGFANATMLDPDKVLEKIRSLYPSTHIQLLRADLVGGKEHLLCAARNAVRGHGSSHSKSRSLAIELLLYVSGQRQISKAIATLGVRETDHNIILVVLSKSGSQLQELAIKLGSIIRADFQDNIVGVHSREKLLALREAYGIGSREMDAAILPGELQEDVVKRLLIERSALLTLEG